MTYRSLTELGTPAVRPSSRRSSNFCLASSSAFCLSAICCLYWASCLSQSAELRSRLPTSPYIAAAMYGDVGNRLRNSADWDKQDAQYKQQIADKQKALDDAKQKLEDLREEGRTAGVPSSVSER